MKTTYTLSTVCCIITAAVSVSAELPLLESIYGQINEISTQTVTSVSDPALRDPLNCIFPLDVLIVQDMTETSTDNWVSIALTQLPKLEVALSITHPGSLFGVMSFKDKPVSPFGEVSDYCYAYDEVELQAVDQLHRVKEFYLQAKPSGGGDVPNNQFGALIAAALSNKIQWKEGNTKLVVLITDSPPHYAEDGAKPESMVEYSGTFDDDTDEQCKNEYYPSLTKVRDALHENNIRVAILVYDGDTEGVANGTIAENWKYVNKFLGQSEDFIYFGDYVHFWENLGTVITGLEKEECGIKITDESTTTTEAVTTTTSTPKTVTGITEASSPVPSTAAVAEECNETTFCSDGVFVAAGFDMNDVKIKITV